MPFIKWLKNFFLCWGQYKPLSKEEVLKSHVIENSMGYKVIRQNDHEIVLYSEVEYGRLKVSHLSLKQNPPVVRLEYLV